MVEISGAESLWVIQKEKNNHGEDKKMGSKQPNNGDCMRLVVFRHPSEKDWSSSIGMMFDINPIFMGKYKIDGNQTTNNQISSILPLKPRN